MKRTAGRPPGRILYTEAFEAILTARKLRKKDVCITAGISPGFLTDLLACRAGASTAVVEALERALAVPAAAIFPEMAAQPWTSPIPNRGAKRKVAA